MMSAQLQKQRWLRAGSVFVFLLVAASGWGQTQATGDGSSDIRTLVLQLQSELKQTRQELAQAQKQIQRLSVEVAGLHPQKAPAPAEPAQSAQSTYLSPADIPEQDLTSQSAEPGEGQSDDVSLLRSRVEEQQQTKVESTSKYRVKLSGIILLNAFSTRGMTDVPDLPNRAFSSTNPGSVGATFRQSILALQVIGPTIADGRTSAGVSVDFFGGYPQTHFGTTNGLMRLREAYARIDWDKTSVLVGQQAPIIAPLSPTSFATLAEPAFSWAGNLWVWTPQAVVEHRFRTGESSYFAVSGALMDPLTEDIPNSSQFTVPGQGQLSRRPAFAGTIAWHSAHDGQSTEIGIGGYTSHLNYGFGREFDSWAATAYWKVPITRMFEFSGEGYRGMGVGGLGGGIWQSAIYNGNPDLPGTVVRPLNSVGGWAQFKYRALTKLEFNAAMGQDNVLAYDFRFAPQIVGDYVFPMARNRAAFGNAIYHLKSNVILSLEYRKLWTYRYTGVRNTADQVNVGAGVSF
jgi:hypothetical protein